MNTRKAKKRFIRLNRFGVTRRVVAAAASSPGEVTLIANRVISYPIVLTTIDETTTAPPFRFVVYVPNEHPKKKTPTSSLIHKGRKP